MFSARYFFSFEKVDRKLLRKGKSLRKGRYNVLLTEELIHWIQNNWVSTSFNLVMTDIITGEAYEFANVKLNPVSESGEVSIIDLLSIYLKQLSNFSEEDRETMRIALNKEYLELDRQKNGFESDSTFDHTLDKKEQALKLKLRNMERIINKRDVIIPSRIAFFLKKAPMSYSITFESASHLQNKPVDDISYKEMSELGEDDELIILIEDIDSIEELRSLFIGLSEYYE